MRKIAILRGKVYLSMGQKIWNKTLEYYAQILDIVSKKS